MKSTTKKVLLIFLCLAMMFSLMACGKDEAKAPEGNSETSNGENSGETIVLRLTHNGSEGQPNDVGTLKLAELVKERTNGRVEIQVFGNNLLGSELACRDMMIEGSVDMVATGSGNFASWFPAHNLALMLYSFNSEEEMYDVLTGEEYGQKYINEPMLSELGLRVLDQWTQSPRQLVSKKPVRSMADLEGLKLRTPTGFAIWDASWEDLGVMATANSLDEVYTALQQNVIDGIEIPIDYIEGYKFYEEAPYVTLTNHLYYTQFIVINENSFQKLSAEDQQILQECVLEAGVYANEYRIENEQRILKLFEDEGVEVIELSDDELQKFAATIEPLYDEFSGDLWDEEAAADFMAALEKSRG